MFSMTRRPLDPKGKDGSKAISCLFPEDDYALIERVAQHYSIPLAAAIRLLCRAGAKDLDPAKPTAGGLKA